MPRMKIAKYRRISVDIPNLCTIHERNKVKKVKLKINPQIIPKGLLFPPKTPPASNGGNMGKMQGDNIVTTPAKKENKRRFKLIFAEYTWAFLDPQWLAKDLNQQVLSFPA